MATTHAKISYIKSVIRILGYVMLGTLSPFAAIAAAVLVVSEVMGIVEEIGL